MLDMRDDTDDLRDLAGVVGEVNAFADGILVGEELAGKQVVDYNDERSAFVVLRGEEATAQQRYLHHAQIIGIDDVVKDPIHLAIVFWFGLAIDPKQLVGFAADGHRAPRLRNRAHAWNGGESLVDAAIGGACRVR